MISKSTNVFQNLYFLILLYSPKCFLKLNIIKLIFMHNYFKSAVPVRKLPQLAPLQKGFWPDPCRANSGCIAWSGTGWKSSGLTRDRTGSSREPAESTQDIVHFGNWPGTSRVLIKYPGESLGLGIYSKPMRPIQKSVSEPIRVIPNKSEASFNPYQSEAMESRKKFLNAF